ELQARQRGREIVMLVRGERTALDEALSADVAITKLEIHADGAGGTARVRFEVGAEAAAGEVVEQAVRRLVEAGAGVRRVESGKASLEEVFAELTAEGGESGAGAGTGTGTGTGGDEA
ncbi:MAG TPA: ABC transporter ATP-binding protein, partial [Polyangiaceae bacterium]